MNIVRSVCDLGSGFYTDPNAQEHTRRSAFVKRDARTQDPGPNDYNQRLTVILNDSVRTAHPTMT